MKYCASRGIDFVLIWTENCASVGTVLAAATQVKFKLRQLNPIHILRCKIIFLVTLEHN
jgi:hypothetical protein